MGSKERIIRRLLDAWNRRDLKSIAPLLAPGFEWPPEPAVYRCEPAAQGLRQAACRPGVIGEP